MSDDKSIIPSSANQLIENRARARELISNAIGTDKLWYIVNGVYVRHTVMDDVKYYSIVDAVAIFSKTDTVDIRRYWSDRKRSLIGANSELYEKIVQLKLPAEDGKMRKVDTVRLWGILAIINELKTPTSYDLINSIFKGVESVIDNAQLKYHAMNIERGGEWASNKLHQRMIEESTDAILFDNPHKDLGY